MHAPSEPVQSLASLQARMAAALLAADSASQAMPEALFTGAHAGAVGLRVHRNTVLGAFANALRLAFPAADKLVGEAFFDRMAIEFARGKPPSAPQLDEFGAAFPDFIGGFPGTETVPYLRELARFEWQFAELARRCETAASAAPSLLLDEGVRLQFSAPLRLYESSYPVDLLRESILAEDSVALGQVDPTPRDHHFAMWRSEQGVHVRSMSAASVRFLAAVYAGGDAASALAAAAEGQSAEAVSQILAQEILPAGFVEVQRPRNSQ